LCLQDRCLKIGCLTDIMAGKDECSQAAQFLLRLADNLQTIPASRSGALVTNIVTGGRQHMTGSTQHQSTRPTVRTGINAQVKVHYQCVLGCNELVTKFLDPLNDVVLLGCTLCSPIPNRLTISIWLFSGGAVIMPLL
jgi:hypothetical protein